MKRTDQDFWKTFTSALAKQGEKRPEGKGWLALDDWVKASGENRSNVSKKLMAGVRLGMMERFQGYMHRPSGGLNRASWYRPKSR